MARSSSSRSYVWPLLSTLVGVYLLAVALPDGVKQWAPDFLRPGLHLGLDLQGGTQLDFRISETEIEQQIATLEEEIAQLEAENGLPELIDDKKAQISNIKFLRINIVEAIRNVLERRINSLGVSEAVITPSYYGEEQHLLVECPGVVDIQECIATVGKTILLEFKEQADDEDAEHKEKMRELAAEAYKRITDSGASLVAVTQDFETRLGVSATDGGHYKDQLPPTLEELWDMTTEDGVYMKEVVLGIVDVNDEPRPNDGVMLAEIAGEKTEVERTIENPLTAIAHIAETNENASVKEFLNIPLAEIEEGYKPQIDQLTPGTLLAATRSDGITTILIVTARTEDKESIEASHILVAYEGAARAEADVTLTKEEAQEKANQLKTDLDGGANFAALAKSDSDGPSGKDGGSLGSFSRGAMTKAFEDAAFALQTAGDISDVVETEFGYHIIRLDSAKDVQPGIISYHELAITGEDAAEKQASWLGDLQNKAVKRLEERLPIRTLFFSFIPTGWKDTALDGKHFQRATVTSDPLTGIPVVQIVFDTQGGKLFQELTRENIEKPIAIFVGGQLVSAPTVQAEIPGGVAIITGSRSFDEANQLAQDLNTGAIPAPIHLVGQVTVEASLGAAALQKSMRAALLGFLLVGIYMIFYYRVLGVIAAISLSVYAAIFFALLKLPLFLLSNQYVVLTLAGIAGIILSIGMAVDANVLIFERMKEELAKGKMLSTAADTGFKRAWSSIRDSNISTLITATILFIIGTSIVRGFAVTLSMGILISMFTAIVVTRFLISLLYKSPIAENKAAFGVKS